MIQNNQVKEKQISYVKFMPRIFSTMLDVYLVSAITFYPMKIIANKLFVYIFMSQIIAMNVDVNNNLAIAQLQRSENFIHSVPFGLILENIIIISLINFLFAALYFICFWHKFGTTPAKYIFGMRVIDATNMGKLSIFSCVKRIFGFVLSPIGMWFIFFTKRSQALHDKISGSLVVKK